MTTTVTLNPCIDLMVRVPKLQSGELNLAETARTDIGGKGVNVSIVLRSLGLPTICTGISYDGNGQMLENHLETHSISRRFALAHGQIRTNIKLHDESGGMTEINHRGYPVEQAAMHEYFRLLLDCARDSRIVVFSGRVPAGGDEAVYRKSIAAIKAAFPQPPRVIVDAEGRPLREALRQRPYLVKVNTRELASAVRRPIGSREDALEAAGELLRRGVEVVCVSMGGEGALIADGDAAFFAPPMPVDVRGECGAGDSMVAGICKAVLAGEGIDEMLRCGVAAASASLLREGTQLCQRKDFERLLPAVELQRIPPTKMKSKKTTDSTI